MKKKRLSLSSLAASLATSLASLTAAAALAAAAMLTAAAPASASAGEIKTLGDLRAYVVTSCQAGDNAPVIAITIEGTDKTSYVGISLGLNKDAPASNSASASLPLGPTLRFAKIFTGQLATEWTYYAYARLQKTDGTFDVFDWSGPGDCSPPENTSTTAVTDTRQTCAGNEELTATTTETWSQLPGEYFWSYSKQTTENGWSVVSPLSKPDAKALNCTPYGGLVKPGKPGK